MIGFLWEQGGGNSRAERIEGKKEFENEVVLVEGIIKLLG